MRIATFAALAAFVFPPVALGQTCPEPLASAKRLVLVVADDFTTNKASLQRFERDAPNGAWRMAGGPISALIGLKGMAWSQSFRSLAKRGEPVKYDGDKRIPAGIYKIGRPFGLAASKRANYLQLREGTVCVDDVLSPAYNTIISRAEVGPKVHGENMWRVPDYKQGLVVDYPTQALLRAGSCIFIHVALPGKTGTAGCVALAEAEVIALQDFAEPGAVLAVLPKSALGRVSCLPN